MQTPEETKGVLPLLGTGLLTGGAAAAVAGLTLSVWDWASTAERLLSSARGEVSAATSQWLQTFPAPSLAFFTAAILLAAGVVAWRWNAPLTAFLARRLTSSSARHPHADFRWWFRTTVLTTAAVVARYPLTLSHGFFRYDDFDLVSLAANTPLSGLLLLPHGDHVLPLTRVLAQLFYELFGTVAWPWNAAVLLCFSAVLALGCRLLHEFGVTLLGQGLFVAAMLLWSPWAELTAGYYILSTYLLIAVCSLGSYLAFLRWRQARRPIHTFGFFACSLVGPLVDISGFYVLAGGLVMFAIDGLASVDRASPREWLRSLRPLFVVWTVAFVIAAAIFVYAYAIAHPGVFLGMAADGEREPVGLLFDTGYAFVAGVLVSTVTPFIYARLPLPALWLLSAGAALAFTTLAIAGFRISPRSRRSALGVMLLLMLGICLMVALGRPPGETPVVRWAAKHVGPAYLWLCLFAVLSWDSLVRSARNVLRGVLAQFTVLATLGYGVLQGGFDWLGMAVESPPFGYPAEIRDADRRRDAVHRLQDHVIAPLLHARASDNLLLPTLNGAYIARLHPSLFTYNLDRYLPFFAQDLDSVTWIRNDAMQQSFSSQIITVPSLRAATEAETIRRLASDPHLRAYYLGEVALGARATEEPRPSHDPEKQGPLPAAPRWIDTPEQREWYVSLENWDPETAHVVRFQMEPRTTQTSPVIRASVSFRSETFGMRWEGWLDLPVDNGILDADLLQVYAFALSERVSDLSIAVPSAQREAIRTISIHRPPQPSMVNTEPAESETHTLANDRDAAAP